MSGFCLTRMSVLLLNSDVTGTWTGFIRGIVGNNLTANNNPINFTVNFGAKSFELTGAAPTFGVLGTMTMDGNFTPEGVIYGSVNFGGPTANTGMLTGLIGQSGLVGAFAGNSELANPYVGGFVATPPGNTAPPVEEEVDCTDALGATLFDESCTDNDDEQTRACINGTDAATANFDANCVDNERVTNLVCAPSGLRANPFNAALCTDLNTGNTLAVKKSLSLISAPILLQQI